jgi:hypothetical protein
MDRAAERSSPFGSRLSFAVVVTTKGDDVTFVFQTTALKHRLSF